MLLIKQTTKLIIMKRHNHTPKHLLPQWIFKTVCFALLVAGLNNTASAQFESSSRNIVTVHSSNGLYSATTLPARCLDITSLGKTDVFSTKDSTLLYTIPVNLACGEVFISNDGRTVLHLLNYDYSPREVPRHTHSFSLYVDGAVKVQQNLKELIGDTKLESITDYLNVGYSLKDVEINRKAMSNNIITDSLLLVTDFNSFCSKKMVGEICQWFEKQFVVVNSSHRARFYPALSEYDGRARIDKTINKIAQEAGIIGTDFAYVTDPETHLTKLMSVLRKTDEKLYGLDADRIESVGTLRLISIMPVIISAMQKGAGR